MIANPNSANTMDDNITSNLFGVGRSYRFFGLLSLSLSLYVAERRPKPRCSFNGLSRPSERERARTRTVVASSSAMALSHVAGNVGGMGGREEPAGKCPLCHLVTHSPFSSFAYPPTTVQLTACFAYSFPWNGDNVVSRESFLTFLRLLQFNNSMDAFLYAVRSSPSSVLSEGLPLHHRLPHHHQWMQMPTRLVASSPSFALPSSVPFIHLMWQSTPRPQPTALLGLDSRSKAVISFLAMM